jgi:hypothetical protein
MLADKAYDSTELRRSLMRLLEGGLSGSDALSQVEAVGDDGL